MKRGALSEMVYVRKCYYDCLSFRDMSGFSPATWRCLLQRKHKANLPSKIFEKSLMLLKYLVGLYLRGHSLLTLLVL